MDSEVKPDRVEVANMITRLTKKMMILNKRGNARCIFFACLIGALFYGCLR